MHCVLKLQKIDGKLKATSQAGRQQYQRFLNLLEEGDVIETYYEKLTDNATLGQISKIHAMIRELAHFTGTTFEGMKLNVKKKAGLFSIVKIDDDRIMHCKSFGDDCSKEDLSLAIQACLEIGETLNYVLN